MVTATVDSVEIATQIIEAIGAIASGIQNMKIIEISQDYYDLYKDQREFYYTVFQQGVEAPLIDEIYNEQRYVKDYAARVGTLYNSVTGPFGGASTDALGWWTRHADMYGDNPDPRIKELDNDIARIQSDWTNHQFRFEESWADTRHDSRWERRLMAHNFANKQATAISSSLSGALDNYQNQIQDLGSMLATYGNGVALYAGYRRGLADTSDAFTTGTGYTTMAPATPTKVGNVTIGAIEDAQYKNTRILGPY